MTVSYGVCNQTANAVSLLPHTLCPTPRSRQNVNNCDDTFLIHHPRSQLCVCVQLFTEDVDVFILYMNTVYINVYIYLFIQQTLLSNATYKRRINNLNSHVCLVISSFLCCRLYCTDRRRCWSVNVTWPWSITCCLRFPRICRMKRSSAEQETFLFSFLRLNWLKKPPHTTGTDGVTLTVIQTFLCCILIHTR